MLLPGPQLAAPPCRATAPCPKAAFVHTPMWKTGEIDPICVFDYGKRHIGAALDKSDAAALPGEHMCETQPGGTRTNDAD